DHAEAVGRWEAAANGAELFMGDGLRTGTSSGALLRVTGAGALTLEEETTVRCLESAPGEEAGRVSVETGEVQAEAGEVTCALETTIGTALVEPGTRLRVQSNDDGTRIEVEIGRAELVREGVTHELEAGRGLEVEIGSAEIVPYALTQAEA